MKVAFCIPIHGDPKRRFMRSAMRMLAHTARPGIEFETFTYTSSVIQQARNELAKMALDWGADYLLWMDCDHTFPPDALLRLLSLKLPLVAVNQPTRAEPIRPTAARGGKLIYTTEEKAKAGEPEEAEYTGLAFCLARSDVFAKLEFPIFTQIAEDREFFHKARVAGYPCMIDHRLSWAMGHIGDRLFTNADANEASRTRTITIPITARK